MPTLCSRHEKEPPGGQEEYAKDATFVDGGSPILPGNTVGSLLCTLKPILRCPARNTEEAQRAGVAGKPPSKSAA